ncbi:eukaryotic translation initiation factor 3subunit J [Striga asiatica]|uniref:Eukaryotic translation initiation factor 3subunit J n=1 Tax=Striga asiatica TaxID=4170 RepID=A0A5A7R6J0_STRAF|nr:eukaryotic translation initiation factor 3subunit J [Striga asiatica]
MEDWEDEPIPDLLNKKEHLKANWDDEDLDDVKESWEDEDEPATNRFDSYSSLLSVRFLIWLLSVEEFLGCLKLHNAQRIVFRDGSIYFLASLFSLAVGSAPKVEPTPSEKVPKKSAAKSGEKKVKAAEASKDAPKEEPLDPVQEKLRQQRLVEEADYKATTELFSKKGDDKTLENFIPKTESDFAEYAELISHKLCPYEKSYHYIGLLKAVMRLSMTSLKGADAKEIASSITAIANEKIKAEKEANAGKKKTGGKKKQLHVGKLDDDVAIDNTYDDLDDYDFM